MVQKSTWIQRFFRFEARNTDTASECKAGITAAVISMFALLGSMQIILKAVGLTENQLLIPLISITLVFSALITIGAGIFTRLPLLFLSTIGFNTFIAVNVIQGLSLDWGVGLAIVAVESILFILLSFTKLPNLFFRELPDYFKKAAPMAIGAILIFFALLAGKMVSFKVPNEVVAWSIRLPEVLLFASGFIITYFLLKEKASFSYMQGFLLTILLGMFIPKALPENFSTASITFWAPFWLLVGFCIVWMMTYAWFVDKHNKKALELSLWIVMTVMVICLFAFFTNAESIIPKPLKLVGSAGIFDLPSFKYLNGIVGYPIYNLGGFFKSITKLWIPILSLLAVHWMSYMALLATINGYIHFRKNETSQYFQKRTVMAEGAFSLLGSVSGTGFVSSLYGTLFAVLSGARTGFSSIISGCMFLVFLFLIPLMSKTFLPYTMAPVLAVFGFKLILDFMPTEAVEKVNWIPLFMTILIAMITMNLYQGISAGLLSYVIVKASHKDGTKISTLTWVLVCLFLVWSFFRISIPTINLVG